MKLIMYPSFIGPERPNSIPYLMVSASIEGEACFTGATITVPLDADLISNLRKGLDEAEAWLAKITKERAIRDRIAAEMEDAV